MGYQQIHLEGDNSTVFKALTTVSTGCSPFHLLVDRLHSLLANFKGVTCSVIRRHDNTTTHLVARWNLGSVRDTIYLHRFPQSLVSFATLDII